MYYDWHMPSGKNNRMFYWLRNLLRLAVPRCATHRKLQKELRCLDNRADKEYILDRVNYYNKLDTPVSLPDDSPLLGQQRLRDGHSMYFWDTFEYTRWFCEKFKWHYLFGDITRIPEHPSILKSRPVAGENQNSVLLNLDKVRHFTFLKDTRPFARKWDKFIFLGHIGRKQNRIDFLRKFYGHPMATVGMIPNSKDHGHLPPEWTHPKISLRKHLDYKFIMALEGNDVASNLKWIMSSNSVAVMPRPTYETWFMEGRLIPDHHYIEIKSDFSDLEERLGYFIAHPEKAEEIVRNANDYITQFLNPARERLISLLVLKKYFRKTNQIL